MFKIAIWLLASMLLAFPATARSPSQRAAFVKYHPCPATGKVRGSCRGWVVDHVVPLCAGGDDSPSNMQWQSKEESLVKDKQEWAQCRALRRQN